MGEDGRAVDQALVSALISQAGYPLYSAATRLVGSGGVVTRELGRGVVWGTVLDGDVQRGLAVHTRWTDSKLVGVRGVCAACDGQPCIHAVAVVLAHWAPDTPAAADEAPGPDAWEQTLQALTGTQDDRPPDDVGLLVELKVGAALPGRRREGRLLLRPVVRGARGRWARTGVTWSSVVGARHRGTAVPDRGADGDPARLVVAEPARGLLRELRRLCADEPTLTPRYGADPDGAIDLQDAASARVWPVLAALQEAGVALLVRSGSRDLPVVVRPQPAALALVADRPRTEIVLSASLTVGDDGEIDAETCVFVGRPAHGVAWVAADGALHLASLREPVEDAEIALHSRALTVPRDGEEAFAVSYYPALRRTGRLRTAPGLTLPELVPTELLLTVDHPAADTLTLTWAWVTGVSTRRRRQKLHAFAGVGPDEERHRSGLLEAVRALLDGTSRPRDLLEEAPSRRLRETATVSGSMVVAVVDHVLPGLDAIPGVLVETVEPLPVITAMRNPPRVEFVSHESVNNDWFELAVTVTIDGETVPLVDLIEPLANRKDVFVTRFGIQVRLDAPELQRLAELIREARTLSDAPLGRLQVGRTQAGMLLDVEDLGRLSGPAAAWAARLRDLGDVGRLAPPALPAGLTADLRPYQREGFAWLTTLYALGLGGVLADDMGLGKTVQTLALVCHAVEAAAAAGTQRPTFLVVAPTSVVHTWAGEAARFAPGLRVATVTQTQAKRRTRIEALAEDADVVVTSYTLFRLEHQAYGDVPWAGVVLDEAQVLKNRRTSTYRHVAGLHTPFRLAISGTPVENDLMELWSLLSLVAPGVLGSAGRFREAYAIRIEKDRDPATLERLRRRIRPILLRRTKNDVAKDLPDKQEQVVEIDLTARHRVAYDRLLQRERQKVLGLIEDREHLEANRFVVFRSLTLLRQAALSLALVDDDADVPSAKLEALAELVADVAAEGHRVLVFSQFTRFLRAARVRLEADGVECSYLDGETPRRAEVVSAFRDGTAPVFLVSLKAGGTGLTLTEADYCVVLDPWWNPAAEAQAVDRTHRIGQTKKVNVYRFVARGTIEEKVMALKERKAALVASVLDGGEFASATITADDVRELLA